MPVKMRPISEIKAHLGIEPNGRVQRVFTHSCKIHMDKYVPYGNGDLSTVIDEQPDSITYEMPYAHYMYEGKVMGPNVPIKENGIIVGWFSPKDKPKHYTGQNINYSKSIARGHTYAGPHWDERMWSAEKDEVVKEVQDSVNRGGK